MTITPINQTSFLRSSRSFPKEIDQLTVEVNKSYIDIANAVNIRTIGVFSYNNPAITGESWFLNTGKQQTLRKVFTVTGAGPITHNIDLSSFGGFTRIYGTFKDNAGVWYPLPYVDEMAANNQISLKVTGTQILITAGTGTPPSIVSGNVVLEWLSAP